MKNQIQIASEAKNSNRASTLAHETRKSMKKAIFFAAIILSAALVMSSCDEKPNDDENGDYLIAGKFASRTGTGDAVFFADYVSGAKSGLKSSSNTERELVGKIEDGDIIFNLSGVYFPATGEFVLSAGSSFLIYEISGTVKNEALTATATVKIRTGSDWVAHTLPVTGVEEVEITGEASDEQSDGLPTNWLGTWTFHNSWYDHTDDCWDLNGEDCTFPNWLCDGITIPYEDVFIITPFSMVNHNEEDEAFPIDILELIRINNTKFDMVVLAEAGEGAMCSNYPCGNDDCCYEHSWFEYVKIRIEQDSNNKLLLTVPWGDNAFFKIDEPGALENARAFSIDANMDEMFVVELTR